MSDIRTYDFLLTGITPFLFHADDVEAADELVAWRSSANNKTVSVPGDDRSPAWTWMTYLYTDGTYLVLPQENLMTALREAGSKVPRKGRSTFKTLTQTGLLIAAEKCAFTTKGRQIAVADILALRDEPFGAQKRLAKELGFDLMIKRAKVGTAKHVRVRARFDSWEVRGMMYVTEPSITDEVLKQLFTIAGRYSGVGDWRPSSQKSPGPYGQFTGSIERIKAHRVA